MDNGEKKKLLENLAGQYDKKYNDRYNRLYDAVLNAIKKQKEIDEKILEDFYLFKGAGMALCPLRLKLWFNELNKDNLSRLFQIMNQVNGRKWDWGGEDFMNLWKKIFREIDKLEIPGLGFGMTAALLHFVYSDKLGMYDMQTKKALYYILNKEKDYNEKSNVSEFFKYHTCFYKKFESMMENQIFSHRDIDKALFIQGQKLKWNKNSKTFSIKR